MKEGEADMEETYLYFLFSLLSLLSILLIFKLLLQKQGVHKNLPPSPPSLPLIGHLHLIKEPIHRALQHLSFKYGPIMSLRLGYRLVVVISSASAAEECFTKNDSVLASRPSLLVGKHIHYNNTTIAAAPYGQLWRDLRRVTTLAMFSKTQVNTYLDIRQGEVRSLVKNLFRDSCQGLTKVEMRPRLRELTFNVVMRIIAGKRYLGAGVDDCEEAKRFKDIISEIFKVSGASTVEDYLPFLLWIDIQGTEKRMVKLRNDSDKFLQSLINEQRCKDEILYQKNKEKPKTIIENLLVLQRSDPEYYSDDIIKGIILILVIAGTDSSSATLEWGMSLLLNHSRILAKAKAELDKYVGHDRLLDESDLPKLHFLQSIINETMRLFPVGPLLVPHESSAECKIGGYDVPRGTMLLVNAWAIHRDPKVWDDPTSFKTERFESEGGEGYKFIPFGMGRRKCPGDDLANRIMALAMGSLIQCFDWERISEELEDMTEGKGLTMPKKKPLEALCGARQQMINVLSDL